MKKQFFDRKKFFIQIIKRKYRYWKASSNLIWMFQTLDMTDPILYLSMLLGLGGVYVLISSFHDDDDGDDDGEKYIYSLEHTNLAK